MSITVKQLYEQTHNRYQLSILAGKQKLSNTVSRLYYIDDINVADWTRPDELIITMGSSVDDDNWLSRLISTIYKHNPSGIIVNTGGYIKEVPADVIEYCDTHNLPLLTFPWDIFLQDVIQDWTNRIFQSDQIKNELSYALLNAVFEPENRNGYVPYLSQQGYNDINSFVVAVIKFSHSNTSSYKYKKELLGKHKNLSDFINNITDHAFCILLDDMILIIFFKHDTSYVESLLRQNISEISKLLSPVGFSIGIGNAVNKYDKLYISYKQALLCVNYSKSSFVHADKIPDQISSISSLGVPGLLITCDSDSIKQYYESHLKSLKDYDINNKTDYFITLKDFLMNNCSINDTAASLFIHRNTVNYRIKRIEELLNVPFNNSTVITEYTVAFMVYDILSVN